MYCRRRGEICGYRGRREEEWKVGVVIKGQQEHGGGGGRDPYLDGGGGYVNLPRG